MKICHRHLFSATLLLFLVSFTVIYMVLPWQLMRFTEHSVPLHHLRRKVSGENQLLAVGNAGHSNATVTREVAKVKSKAEKREEGLARARALIRRAALVDNRNNLTTPTTPHNNGSYIPVGAVYRNPRLFYQRKLELEGVPSALAFMCFQSSIYSL